MVEAQSGDESWIDSVALQFDRAWRSGARPRIEDHLADLAESRRRLLLGELIRIELERRRGRGEDPSPAEYHRRFSDDAAVIKDIFDPPGNSPEPTPTPASSSRRAGKRFRIVRFHKSGGLGQIYVAYDEELGREVALKEILPDKAADTDLRSRFVLEAEINGGLEHPGIVPVYSLGTYDDGLPFYAMRFVEGDSLREAIESCHKEHPRPDPTTGEFRKLLGRFVHVCQAIAFAHSKGVLHRDLKPHNVMLGRYGETLLIDWGMAKVIGHGEPSGSEVAPGVTLVPRSGSGHAATKDAHGTPLYMSPEQAALAFIKDGDKLEEAVKALGPATDIYGLGAILFALLTGEPPVERENVEEEIEKEIKKILDRVQRGEIRQPRSLNPHIPRSLEAVCLKALAQRPEDRYPDCEGLADDLERWLADEPVSAWHEPLALRAWRWVRHHRTVVTAAVVALVVGVIGLSAVAFVQYRANSVSRALAFRATTAEVETRKLLAKSYADAGILAAQRGAWREALVQFDKALGSRYPDSLDLEIWKIRCWIAVNDEGHARDQLASVLKRHDLGGRQGQVLLLQADLGQARVLKTADREALILRALEAGLPPAEEALARGLIARSTPEAADYFREAVRLDPFARGAANRLGFLLILSGRHLEARDLIARSLLLFPEDPSPKVQRSVLAAFEGDLASADKMLAEAQPQISDTVAKVFRQANRLVARVHDLEDLNEEFAKQNIQGAFKICLSLARDLIPLNRAMAEAGETTMTLFDMPPYLANWQSRMTSAAGKLLLWRNGPLLAELEATLRVHPEGTIWLLYGLCLGAEKRFEDAEAALIRAAETPAAFKCRRMALLSCDRGGKPLSYAGQSHARTANPEPEERQGLSRRR